MVTPNSPRAPAARITSSGNWPVSSIAAARGATTSRANSSTDSLKASCSGVSSRCIFSYQLSVVRGHEAFEDRPQTPRRLTQILREHPRAADDGHEVGVSGPPRHQVDVN